MGKITEAVKFLLLRGKSKVEIEKDIYHMKELENFKFPELKGIDLVFSTLKTDKKLLSIATEAGFYNGNKKGNKMFSTVFYSGGKLVFKEFVNESHNSAIRYLKSFITSWEPKHEEKEAICAMLLEWLVERVENVD